MRLDKRVYTHPLEARCLADMKKILVGTDALTEHYEQFVVESQKPELLGKALRISTKQFPRVHGMIRSLSQQIGMDPPDSYVMESLYYDVNAEGSKTPWLQITAKTILDLDEMQLRFLIARQLIHIHCDHVKYEALREQTLDAVEFLKGTPAAVINVVGTLDSTIATYRFVMAKWSRASELTADAGAYLLCDSQITSCVYAILTTIFNNRTLAQEIDIQEYTRQASAINRITSTFGVKTRMEELIPYGPYRIQELFRFASSPRSKLHT